MAVANPAKVPAAAAVADVAVEVAGAAPVATRGEDGRPGDATHRRQRARLANGIAARSFVCMCHSHMQRSVA